MTANRNQSAKRIRLSFNMPKALSVSDGLSQVYTIGPWLIFAKSENVRNLISQVSSSGNLWVETLDDIPPETLLLIERASTLRIAIDVSENMRKETAKKAFDIAKRWQEVIRSMQGYRVESERDIFLANLEKMRKQSSYGAVAKRFNKFIAQQLKEAIRLIDQKEYSTQQFDDRIIANINGHHALDLIRKTLSYLFSAAEVNEILQDAIERIKNSQEPFEDEYPLSRDALKENYLKEWKRRTGGKIHQVSGGED